MNCPIQSHNPEMLVDYAAGTLDPEATSALKQHLAGCSACRAITAEHTVVWKALDAWEVPPVTANFDGRLYRRIEEGVHLTWWERLTRAIRPMPLRQSVPLAASVALLLMAGLILQYPGSLAPVDSHREIVRAKQVERTLDDLDLLRQFGAADSAESGQPHAL